MLSEIDTLESNPEEEPWAALRMTSRMHDDPYPSFNTPVPVVRELPPEPPDVEGYEIVSVLGQGAMSIVYEARPRTNAPPGAAAQLGGQHIALKALREQYAFDRECVARLEREVRIAACIQSPHVPKTFGIVVSRDRIPCIAMELLTGRSLADLLDERGTFSVAETLDCVFQICAALRAAHPLGVVHRDLKASNIFFAEESGKVVVKVMDFGLSKLEGDLELTAQNALFGTPKYMSPEQVRSATLADARSDLWSLGVILYRMLSGKYPFDERGYAAVLSAICSREPVHLSVVMPELDRLLATVVMNLLKKDPALRYQDVDELEGALRTFAESESQRDVSMSLHEPSTSLALPLSSVTAAGVDEAETLRRMRPSRFRAPAVLALLAATLGTVAVALGSAKSDTNPAQGIVLPDPPSVGIDASSAAPSTSSRSQRP